MPGTPRSEARDGTTVLRKASASVVAAHMELLGFVTCSLFHFIVLAFLPPLLNFLLESFIFP
jgi:hypothetical protein